MWRSGSPVQLRVVLTEYFAYLRRDFDQGGYDFWLNVLNNREPATIAGWSARSYVGRVSERFSSVLSHNNGECGQ